MLAGEVDIDHALGASILRHAEPALFQVLASRADVVRFSDNHRHSCEFIISQVPVQSHRREAAITLLLRLFGPESKACLQGFSQTKPVDYWARFLARAPILKGDSDQSVLAELHAFAIAGSERLVEMSMNADSRARIMVFESLLPCLSVLCLFDAQLQWIQKTRPDWPHGGSPPGLDDTYSLCFERSKGTGWPRAEAFKVVDAHLRASVQREDLRLVGWLVARFAAHDSPRVAKILSPNHREALYRNAVRSLLDKFSDCPLALARALIEVEPWLLHRLCYGFEKSRYAANEVPFIEWPDFAKALVSAARACAEPMLPQLAPFLTQCALEQGLRYKATVDHDAISRLFPDNNILSLFAQHPEITSAHPETQARIVALQTAVEAPEPAATNSG